MSLLGLVADYGTDSESAEEDSVTETTNTKQGEQNKKIGIKEGKNLLELNDSCSSDEDEPVTTTKDDPILAHRLPNPLLDSPNLQSPFSKSPTQNQGNAANYSVFNNQYQQAEKAKHQILEKHVRMTEAAKSSGKKQICYKFRKGKCRFGKSCRFSHDLDEVSTPNSNNVDSESQNSALTNNIFGHGRIPYGTPADWSTENSIDDKDDDSYMANMKRKRRAGINDSLLPSKKALVPLEQQRVKERPWTVEKSNR